MKGDFEIMFSRETNRSYLADMLGLFSSNDSAINEIISDAAKDNVFVESIRFHTNTLDPYINCRIDIRVGIRENTRCFPIYVYSDADYDKAMNEVRKKLCDFIDLEIEKME